MGHKGVRAMTPVPADTANELRIKLGRGRELPAESKPKRAAKPKEVSAESELAGGVAAAKAGSEAKEVAAKRVLRPVAAKVARGESDVETEPEPIKPAATIFRPAAAPVS